MLFIRQHADDLLTCSPDDDQNKFHKEYVFSISETASDDEWISEGEEMVNWAEEETGGEESVSSS